MKPPVISQNMFTILRTFIAALLVGILMRSSLGVSFTVNLGSGLVLELMYFIGITTTLNFLDKQYMKVANRSKVKVN